VRRRVAVTGASGFIGGHLTSRLAELGNDVIRIPRPFAPDALVSAFSQADVVVHLAGVIVANQHRDYVDGNVTSTRIVAEAAQAAGTRLVHVSSLAAAGPASPRDPRDEAAPSAPITVYGRTKLAGEAAITGLPGLRWTILRPGVVYGPGDRALLPLFRLACGRIMPLVGRRTAAYTFVYISDMVRATLAAMSDEATGQIFFVGHREPVTARALIEGIRAAVSGRAVIVPIPRPVLRLAAWAGDLATLARRGSRGGPVLIDSRRYDEVYAQGFVCRVDRLRNRLGVDAQVPLEEGLRQTARWYRSENWL
jgi:nucleoside-diphosphate-sugar epimerase